MKALKNQVIFFFFFFRFSMVFPRGMSYLRSNSDSDSKESTPKPAGKQSYCVGFPQLRFPQACVLDLFEIGTLIPLLSRFPRRHSLLATIVKFVEMEHVFHQNNTQQLKSLSSLSLI